LSRIIFVNRVAWPSAEATAQLLTDLADGLAAKGWEVHIATASTGPDGRTTENGSVIEFHRLETEAGKPARSLWRKAWQYRRFTLAAKHWLQSFLRKDDILVLMTDPPLLGPKLLSTLRHHHVQLYHWTQDIYPEVAIALTQNRILQRWLHGWIRLRNEAWKDSAHIVAIGEDMADLIAQQIGKASPITIIPNWFPEHHRDSKVDFRARWKINPHDLLVVYAGNLGRAHTLDPVLELAAQTRDLPNVVYYMVGGGAQAPKLKREAKERGLTQVRFEPAVPRDELYSLLTAADVHLITMRPECRGTVLPSKFYGIVNAGRPCIFIGPTDSDLARLITDRGLGTASSPEYVFPAEQMIREHLQNPSQADAYRTRVSAYRNLAPGRTETIDAWDRLLRSSI